MRFCLCFPRFGYYAEQVGASSAPRRFLGAFHACASFSCRPNLTVCGKSFAQTFSPNLPSSTIYSLLGAQYVSTHGARRHDARGPQVHCSAKSACQRSYIPHQLGMRRQKGKRWDEVETEMKK
jgi:hypothetical protein